MLDGLSYRNKEIQRSLQTYPPGNHEEKQLIVRETVIYFHWRDAILMRFQFSKAMPIKGPKESCV